MAKELKNSCDLTLFNGEEIRKCKKNVDVDGSFCLKSADCYPRSCRPLMVVFKEKSIDDKNGK